MMSYKSMVVWTVCVAVLFAAQAEAARKCTPSYAELEFRELQFAPLSGDLGASYVTTLNANGDAYPDVAWGTNDGYLWWTAGGPQWGNASAPVVVHAVGNLGALYVFDFTTIGTGDVTGDGRDDMVVISNDAFYNGPAPPPPDVPSTLRLWTNPGGAATAPWSVSEIIAAPPAAPGILANMVTVVDVTNDGVLDVVASITVTLAIPPSPVPPSIFVVPGSGGGSFGSPVPITAVWSNPGAFSGATASTWPFVVADMDGDGANDLVVNANPDVTVYPGSPSAPPSTTGVTILTKPAWLGNIATIGVGDVDADGVVDLATADNALGRVSIHFGAHGTGSTLASGYGVDPCAYADLDAAIAGKCVAIVGLDSPLRRLELVDVSGDGFLDIHTGSASEDSGSWNPFLPTRREFVPTGRLSIHVPSGDTLTDALLVDINADGVLDELVIQDFVGRPGSSVGLNIQPQAIVFDEPIVVASEVPSVRLIEAQDMTNSGGVDIVAAVNKKNLVVVVPSLDGLGTYGSFVEGAGASVNGAEAFAVADWNGDGSLDLVAGSDRTGALEMFINDGGGGFVALSPPTAAERYIVPGAPGVGYPAPWIHDDAAPTSNTTTAGLPAEYVTALDLDEDNDIDLVFVDPSLNMVGWIENTPAAAASHPLLPAITWVVHPVAHSIEPRNVVLDDMNDDGLLDMAWSDIRSCKAVVVLNVGTVTAPTFGAPIEAVFVPNPQFNNGNSVCPTPISDCDPLVNAGYRPGITWVSTGDVDGDGFKDVVATGGTKSEVYLARGNGAGAFAAHDVLFTGGSEPATVNDFLFSPRNPNLADFDGDGDIDILFGALGLSDALFVNGLAGVYLLTNPGAVAPTPWDIRIVAGGRANVLTSVISVKSTLVVDVNGDSILDIMMGDEDKRVVLAFPRQPSIFSAPVASILHLSDFKCAARNSMVCIYGALSSLPKCAVERSTLYVPPGTYTECFLDAHGPVIGRIVVRPDPTLPPGDVVFNCSAGGVLFDVTEDSELTLESITIVGTTTGKTRTATTALRAAAPSASITLINVTVTDASTAVVDASVTQFQAGLGSVLSISSGASATVVSSTFERNVAGAGGGVFVVSDSGTRLTVTDSEFVGCSATDGVGGVIYVTGSGSPRVVFSSTTFAQSSARAGGVVAVDVQRKASASASLVNPEVTFDGCTFDESHASEHGGVFAVVAPASAAASALPRVVVVDSAVSTSSAPWGGVVSGVRTSFALNTGTTARNAAAAPLLVRLDNTAVASASATYGGVAYACGGKIELTNYASTGVSGVEATQAGGVAYQCVFSSATPFVVGADAGTLPDGVANTPAYGRIAASAGAEVRPVVGLASSFPDVRESGVALGSGAVEVVDAFGQVVDNSGLSLTVRVATAPVVPGYAANETDVVLTGGARTRVLLDGVVSFADVAVSRTASVGAGAAVLESRLKPQVVPVVLSIEATGNGAVDVTSVASAPLVVNVNVSDCSLGNVRDVSVSDKVVFACRPDCGENAVPYAPDKGESANATHVYVDGNVAKCMCLAGFYPGDPEVGTAEGGCVACIRHGVCRGRFAWPKAVPGYFDVSNSDGRFADFRKCPRKESCSGGNVCKTGSTGFMCRLCIGGYYADPAANGLCKQCPPASSGLTAIFVLILVVGGVVAALLLTVLKKANEDSQAESDSYTIRTTRIPYALSVGTVFLQVVGVLAKSRLEYPPATRSTMNVFNVFNLDANILASECSLGSFELKYLVSIAYPLVFLLWVTLALYVLRVLKGRGVSQLSSVDTPSLVDTLERLLVIGAPILYIPLSRSTLILFDCTRLPDGKWYLDADLGKQCGDAGWWGIFPFGLAALFLYVLGIPAFVGYTLYNNRNNLFEPATLAKFGGLYRLYRRTYPYFELLQLGRRILIVVASLFFSSLQVWQLGLLLLVFGAAAFVFTKYDPYYLPVYNTLEIRLNLSLAALTALGGAFWADDFPNRGSLIFFAFLAILVIVIGIVLIGAAAYREIRQRMAAKKAAEAAEAAAVAELGTGQVRARPKSIALDPQLEHFFADFEKRAEDWDNQAAADQVRSIRSSLYAADGDFGGTGGTSVEMVNIDDV